MKTAINSMLIGLTLVSTAALMAIWSHAAAQAAAGGMGAWIAAVAAMPWNRGRRTGGSRLVMGVVGAACFAAALGAVASQDPGPARLAVEVAMIAGVNLGFPACFAIMLLATRRGVIRVG